MPKITDVKIRKILDSRGNPTVEAEVYANSVMGIAAAPSGASKGAFEVKEYPDQGIDFAIKNMNSQLASKLVGNELSFEVVDKILHQIDGTPNFSEVGGNVAVAISLATAKTAARAQNMQLYQLLLSNNRPVMPYPLGNVIGGGKHATNGTTMQEFMAISFGKRYFESAFANIQVHKKIGELLKARFSNIPLGLGDEKAWVAMMNDEQALEMIQEAISWASEKLNIDIRPAVDMAATSFYSDSKYHYKSKSITTAEQIDFVAELVDKFSIRIVEDPLEENDFEGFSELTKRIGKDSLIVGDDLFVTNKQRLQRGIAAHAANAVLIKPNQIGTLSDMIDTVALANKNNYQTIISHRSGETEDSTIAHLAVGLGIPYIKSGTIGGERTAKHNELIRIEEMISSS